jgi:hypothetical protein
MNITPKPRTAEEIAALPEGGGFGMEERLIDGVLRRVPVAPDVVVIFHEQNDVISYVDQDGTGWKLGRYADGRWFKQRR